jgi:hypothetical protein
LDGGGKNMRLSEKVRERTEKTTQALQEIVLVYYVVTIIMMAAVLYVILKNIIS